MSVVVFGSINMDLVARTPRLPAPAETITGHKFFTAPGGKGANQAVAAARLNAPTQMIGRLGSDSFGHTLRHQLEVAGVDTSAVIIDPDVSSGVAIIAVDDAAQNNIIIVPGANGHVDAADVERLTARLPQADLLLLQLEIPMEATLAAARQAVAQQVPVILDPAPATDLPPELYPLLNIITPNEVEAAHLVGFPVTTIAQAKEAAGVLLAKGVKTAIIKLGGQGVVYARQGQPPVHLPAFAVTAVDTVAAGDAFNGGLAAALIEQKSLDEAVRWGAAAGALSATRSGAQPSLPTRAEFDQFLQQVRSTPQTGK